MGLKWTAAGAVAGPTTVQIRVTARFEGRVPAGAPLPSRSLTDEELRANLEHFTIGLRGPRTRPCTTVVLAGTGLSGRDLAPMLATARQDWGLERVVLHLGRGERAALKTGPLSGQADTVVVTVEEPEDVDDVAALTSFAAVTAVVPLRHPDRVADLVTALRAANAGRIVLTWPFPPGDPPPPAASLHPALAQVGRLLEGEPWGVKGLPPCVLPPETPTWRSANRWYVDAAHQLGEALLFFPDVVRFIKIEACRFCQADPRCDGIIEPWWKAGLIDQVTGVTGLSAPGKN